MIKRRVIKTCCNSQSYIFETPKNIKKPHIKIFTDAGYIAPPNFVTAGIFYIRGNGLVATCAFGSKKINVKCSGHNCGKILNNFEQLLEKAILKI